MPIHSFVLTIYRVWRAMTCWTRYIVRSGHEMDYQVQNSCLAQTVVGDNVRQPWHTLTHKSCFELGLSWTTISSRQLPHCILMRSNYCPNASSSFQRKMGTFFCEHWEATTWHINVHWWRPYTFALVVTAVNIPVSPEATLYILTVWWWRQIPTSSSIPTVSPRRLWIIHPDVANDNENENIQPCCAF